MKKATVNETVKATVKETVKAKSDFIFDDNIQDDKAFLSNETYNTWLDDKIKSHLLISSEKGLDYTAKYLAFKDIENQILTDIFCLAYDKKGIYKDIKNDFTADFGLECKFSNKVIFGKIVELSFLQFKSNKLKSGKWEHISDDLNKIYANHSLILDFDFGKWILKGDDNKNIGLDLEFTNLIPSILANITKILSHNSKPENTAKQYLIEGLIVTKNGLKSKFKTIDNISILAEMLETSIKNYNEAFNINVLMASALKRFEDKSKLIELLKLIDPAQLDAEIKARKSVEVTEAVA